MTGSDVKVRDEIPFREVERIALASQQRDFANIDRTMMTSEMLYVVTTDQRTHLAYIGGHVAGHEYAERLRRALDV